MDGPALVDLLASGDPRGMVGVYDAYADRLFAYCISVLHDRDAAADAVHDTLLIARERITQLRDPYRLRPWLYAIARNECLRALRDRRRTAELDEAADVTDDSPELDAALRADELRELVWSAAASLNAGEREVLELSVRHGLEGHDLAAALGVSANHASALLSRARTQLERALSALVLARTGRDDCPELDGLLGDWDGRLTALLRKRLVRHLERCDICGEQRRLRVSAAALLAGVPFVVAPFALRERVLRDAGDMRLVAAWEALARRAGPYRPDGFPSPLDQRRRRALIGWWSAAAAAAAIVALLLGLFVMPGTGPRPVAGEALAPTTTLPDGTGDQTDPATAPTVTDDPTTPTPSPTGTTVLTGQPVPPPVPGTTTPLVVVAPTSTTTPPAVTRTTTSAPATQTSVITDPPPPAPTITIASTTLTAQCRQAWAAQLTATINGATATAVTAYWQGADGASHPVPMQFTDPDWTATVRELPVDPDMTWYAVAVLDNRTTLKSDTAPLLCTPPPG